MADTTRIDDPPVLIELPLGVAAAFLALAVAAAVGEFEDRPVIIGLSLAGAALAGVAAALVWGRRGKP